MRVLAFDTSTELGSVAVLVDGELRAEIDVRVGARHAETLLSLIEAALLHAQLAREEIDLLAVGIGPGSFTGTRIGVATAKGLALALDRPLLGIVSLRALALAAPGRFLVPAVDAHKGEIYVAAFERDERGELVSRLAPVHGAPDEAFARVRAVLPVERLAICGSGLRRYAGAIPAIDPCVRLPPLWDAPRASVLAIDAEARFIAGACDDRAELEPLYVRASDAKPSS